MARLKPQHANIPWIVSFEFPSHADAKVFANMVQEQFGDEPVVRKKKVVFNQGAFGNWRTTTAIREALLGRSFTPEMIGEVLADNGYAGTKASASAWLSRATSEGIIVRLEQGIYEFAAQRDLCAACQPEPLQCQPA